MTRFVYEAIDQKGDGTQGVVDAASKEGAVSSLLSLGLTPTTIRTEDSSAVRPNVRLLFRRGIKPLDTVEFTRDLASLLRADLTIDGSLAVIRNLSVTSAQRHMIDALLSRIRAGVPLSDALQEQGAPFSADYIGMVHAGELGGSLPDTLLQLSAMLERSQEVRSRLMSSLIYPAILAAMMLVTIGLVVGVVLPRMESLFGEAKADLPLATRVVLACGHVLRDYGWILALCVISGVAAASKWLRAPQNRLRLDSALLGWGRVGDCLALSEFARLARVLGTLLKGGVPLPTGLHLSKAAIRNAAIAEGVASLITKTREGLSLGRELARMTSAPRLLVSLVTVGEQTGHLDDMLLQAADVLDRQLQTRTERYMALVVPVLTVALGLMVAALVGSVLIGILSVNDLAV